MISGLEKTAWARAPAGSAGRPAGSGRRSLSEKHEARTPVRSRKTVSSGVRGQRWKEGGTMSRTTEPSVGVSAGCTVPTSSRCEASGRRARSCRRGERGAGKGQTDGQR